MASAIYDVNEARINGLRNSAAFKRGRIQHGHLSSDDDTINIEISHFPI